MILHHTHPIGQGNRLCHSPLTLRPQLRTYNRCAPMIARRIAALLVTGVVAGCALYSDVSISPLLVPQSNNFWVPLDCAPIASEHGLIIKQLHTDYWAALSNVDVYRTTGAQSERMALRIGRPDVPRVDAKVNGKRDIVGIIDSGAVLSIL